MHDHILAEIIKHATSPLTSAILIFGTYKLSHLPKMASFLRAARILRRHRNGTLAPLSAAAPHLAVSKVPAASPTVGPVSRPTGKFPLSTSAGSLPRRYGGAHPLAPTRMVAALSRPVVAPIMQQRRGMGTVGAIVDAVCVHSDITGTLVPWSVLQFEHLVTFAHERLHLNWWSSLASVTLLFRFAVLPLNVSLVRNTARLYSIRSDIYGLDAIMRDPASTPEAQVKAAQDLQALLKERRCHPFKNLASPFIFPPVFLSLFGCVLDVCTSGLPGISTGGILWFTDLSQPDPTKILPVVSGITWLATIELASGRVFRMPAWMLSATRLGAVAFIPVTDSLPAGVFMFWITSNLFAMTRAWLLRQRPVAAFFGIPDVNRLP